VHTIILTLSLALPQISSITHVWKISLWAWQADTLIWDPSSLWNMVPTHILEIPEIWFFL
jgi:hypothetical protein